MSLIKSVNKDQALLDEVNQYAANAANFHLWWLGQSGYLITWNGKRLLLDPYLSDSLTEKYASTNKPHIRMSELVVRPELLKGISIITSSHNHTDHLDGHTLIPLFKNNPQATFIIPEANRAFVAERTKQPLAFPVGVNDGEWLQTGDFSFFGVPAKHNEIECDSNGRCKYMGYIIRFGKWTLYHSGDTLWFDELISINKPFNVDVAFLPINGDDPARGVAGNLNCKEAADLGKAIGAKLVIPCHYNMFTFNTADPRVFAEQASNVHQRFKILEHGEHWSSAEL